MFEGKKIYWKKGKMTSCRMKGRHIAIFIFLLLNYNVLHGGRIFYSEIPNSCFIIEFKYFTGGILEVTKNLHIDKETDIFMTRTLVVGDEFMEGNSDVIITDSEKVYIAMGKEIYKYNFQSQSFEIINTPLEELHIPRYKTVDVDEDKVYSIQRSRPVYIEANGETRLFKEKYLERCFDAETGYIIFSFCLTYGPNINKITSHCATKYLYNLNLEAIFKILKEENIHLNDLLKTKIKSKFKMKQ